MSYHFKHTFYLFIATIFLFTSCEQLSLDSASENNSPSGVELNNESLNSSQVQRSLDIEGLSDINQSLADRGLNVRLSYAETVTLGEGGANAAGQTIFANDRQKQLTAQWVAGDTRRNADGDNLNYLVDQTSSLANFGTADQVDSEASIDASFDTWNSVKKNPKLNIVKRPDPGVEPSIIFGGNPFLADISEIGFLPGIFFDIVLEPGASENVLGVTFTYVFIDGDGNPTDINNDGFDDVALKEVWYNDDFLWTTDANGPGVDIETVALHENGHALGFGHFGKISITNNNGKLHVSPRSVMNAIVLGTQRDLLGTDKASYNSIYGSWPN